MYKCSSLLGEKTKSVIYTSLLEKGRERRRDKVLRERKVEGKKRRKKPREKKSL